MKASILPSINNRPVGRFAPSPSGRMHLGNVFSALLAWLSVKAQGGEMLLRIEDLDPERSKPVFADAIKRDLQWLGLPWDMESTPQSQRTAQYQAAFDRLQGMGLVYPCYCTRAERHAASAPHGTDGQEVYPGTCRNRSPVPGRRPAWRLCTEDAAIFFTDGLQGNFSENLLRQCGDFIIRRSDGVFAYQLAVVVDDGALGVTQVVRGCDLLSSTPRQLYLYRLLGMPAPEYFHVPLLVAPDGRRLSKRDGDLNLEALQQRFSSEELIGLLACAAGLQSAPEPRTPAALAKTFSWDKVIKENTIDIQSTFHRLGSFRAKL